KIEYGDTIYELWIGPCKCGRHQVHRLMRTAGFSLSVYEISPEDAEHLDEYVTQLHTSFAIDAATRLYQLRETIQKFNSNRLFEDEGIPPFRVRLIDKARLICNRFAKNGLFAQLVENADDPDDDIALAFILGCIATENHWLSIYQDVLFEGYAHIEGRESGRP